MWIRPAKRWAIYYRDKLRCVYCSVTLADILVEYDDNFLTIDHVTPRSRGGTHEAGNLVTACYACNLLKARDTLLAFTTKTGGNYNTIKSRVRMARTRDMTAHTATARAALGMTEGFEVLTIVADHDWLVKRQWAPDDYDALYWAHVRGDQTELWCSKCQRAQPGGDNHLEPIPF